MWNRARRLETGSAVDIGCGRLRSNLSLTQFAILSITIHKLVGTISCRHRGLRGGKRRKRGRRRKSWGIMGWHRREGHARKGRRHNAILEKWQPHARVSGELRRPCSYQQIRQNSPLVGSSCSRSNIPGGKGDCWSFVPYDLELIPGRGDCWSPGMCWKALGEGGGCAGRG